MTGDLDPRTNPGTGQEPVEIEGAWHSPVTAVVIVQFSPSVLRSYSSEGSSLA